MDWTDETIARLRELWSQGLSTAEIGRQLSITKNAVVGKAHRLQLPARPSPIRNRPAKDGEGAESAPKRKSSRASKPVEQEANNGEATSKEATLFDAKVPVTDAAPAAEVREAVAPVAAEPRVPAKADAGDSADQIAKASPVEPEAAAQRPAPRVVETAVTSAAPASGPAPHPAAAQPAPKPSAPKSSATKAPAAKPPEPKRFHEGVDRPVRRGPSCCWPFGDPGKPGFHFCGARPLPNKPYCAEHAAIAYVKIRDRREGG